MKLLCDMRYLMANLSGFFMTTRMHIYLFYCCRDKKPAQFSYVFVYFVRCELSFFFDLLFLPYSYCKLNYNS